MNVPKDLDSQISHCWQTHSYLNSYIQFADGKAGVLMVFSVGAIATTLRSDVYSAKPDNVIIADLGVATLAVSFLFGLLAITPSLFTKDNFKHPIKRLRESCGLVLSGKSSIFWNGIVAHGRAEDFFSSLCQLDKAGFALEVSNHLFELSMLLKLKYRWVFWETVFFASGILLIVAFFWMNGLRITESP